jgi:hypothetical protein
VLEGTDLGTTNCQVTRKSDSPGQPPSPWIPDQPFQPATIRIGPNGQNHGTTLNAHWGEGEGGRQHTLKTRHLPNFDVKACVKRLLSRVTSLLYPNCVNLYRSDCFIMGVGTLHHREKATL